jgi:exodeoxyribonuclease III
MLCLQELKASREQIEQSLFESLGYEVYWFAAEKPGYSGVAVLSRRKPDHVERGMLMSKYDREGRLLRLDFGDVSLLSVYIPSGTTGGERQAFKMEFLDDFLKYISGLKTTRGKLIISGDFNICHKPIDINHPEKHKTASGFLPEERAWMDAFVDSGFIDTFRVFNQQPNQYSWWSFRAGSRAKNLGWRIDYHMVTKNLKGQLIGADIHSTVAHSDHCPVGLCIDF